MSHNCFEALAKAIWSYGTPDIFNPTTVIILPMRALPLPQDFQPSGYIVYYLYHRKKRVKKIVKKRTVSHVVGLVTKGYISL